MPEFKTFSEWFDNVVESSKELNKTWAIRLKVAPSTIGDWRNGVYVPEGEMMMRIAKMTGVKPQWLFCLINGLLAEDSNDAQAISPIRAAINAKLDELGDNEEILELIRDQLGTVLIPHGLKMLERAKQRAKRDASK